MDDNKFTIDVELGTEEFKLGSKELEAGVRRMAGSIEGLGASAEASMQRSVNAFAKQNNAINQQIQKIEQLKAQRDAIANQKIYTDNYKTWQSDMDEAKAKLVELKTELEILKSRNADENSFMFKKTVADIQLMENKIKQTEEVMQTLVNTGEAFTIGGDTTKIDAQIEQATEKLRAMATNGDLSLQNLNGTLLSYQEKAEKARQKTEDLAKSMKDTSKASVDFSKSFKKGFMTILKYGLGIRSLFILIRKLKAAVKEGINNLVQVDGGLNKSVSDMVNALSRLKNALATAFAPIITVIAPYITKFINMISNAVTSLARLIAMLTGKSSFMKATAINDDYAKSLDKSAKGTNKNTKANKKYLSSLDEIATFQSNKDDSGGGGGATPADMFTTEEIPVGAFEKLNKVLDPIKKKFAELKGLFKDGFLAGLGNFEPRIQNIKDNLKSIYDSLKEIFTDENVVASFNNMLNKWAYALGQFAGAMVSIGITIAQNLIGGLAKYLEQNKDRIKEFLISMFDIGAEIAELMGNFFQAFAYVFEAFGDENGQQLTANIIGIFNDAFMGLLELAGKIGRDILQLLLQPFIDNQEEIRKAFDGILEVLADLSGTLKDIVDWIVDNLNDLYDNTIKPIVDDVTKDISELVKNFLEAWNRDFQPVLKRIGEMVKDTWEKHLKPVFEKAKKTIELILDLLKKAWDGVLKPLFNWLIQYIMPILAPIIEGIAGVVKGAIDTIIEIIGFLWDILNNVLEFVKNGFETDWTSAWKTMDEATEKILDGLAQKFKDIFNGILSTVEKAINGIIKGINKIFGWLNNQSIDIPDWVPDWLGGGSSFGFNFNTIGEVSLPRLATGAVIPPNAPFMAMLGDQRNGNNLEMPEGLLRQVVREESGSGGTYRFTATINRRTLFDEMITEAKIRQTTSGINPFEMA